MAFVEEIKESHHDEIQIETYGFYCENILRFAQRQNKSRFF